MKEVVVLSAVRTPVGAFGGALAEIPATQLGATAIKAAVQKSNIPLDRFEEALMGCVLPAGLGQAPARQAALYAGLPNSICCTTVNRVCGSGLKTVIQAMQGIQLNDIEWAIAGGMESMSQSPYLLERARQGYRMGPGQLVDSMIKDGLWDVYNNFHMGKAAELCAKERKISREDQDRYAIRSYQLAQKSIESKAFESEITPVEVKHRGQTSIIDKDEEPFRAQLDRFQTLKPVFDPQGSVTAANASSLSDGAAALVLTSSEGAKSVGAKPIAKILGHASHAQAPEWFTTAPVGATEKLLKKTSFKREQIDLFEINEAFAVVALACIKELRIPEEKVNTRGGAIALGHPLGCTGARILTTLIHTLKQTHKRYGIATLCIGGGEATAILVEAL